MINSLGKDPNTNGKIFSQARQVMKRGYMDQTNTVDLGPWRPRPCPRILDAVN